MNTEFTEGGTWKATDHAMTLYLTGNQTGWMGRMTRHCHTYIMPADPRHPSDAKPQGGPEVCTKHGRHR